MRSFTIRILILCGLFFSTKLTTAQSENIEIIGSSIPPYDWSAGVNMPTTDGNTYTLLNYTLPGGEVKFRQNQDWAINWGAGSFPSGTGFQDGPNIPVIAGTYNIIFNRLTGQYNFVCVSTCIPSIGILGTALNGWDVDVDLQSIDGVNYSLLNYPLLAGEAKFRQDNDWLINWGNTDFPSGIGLSFGPNIPITAGNYNIYFNRVTGAYNFECIGCYCTTGLYDANYSCLYGSAINDFTLSNIHQYQTGCTGAFTDYTSLTGDLAQGESYFFNAISTTTGYNTIFEFIGIWIDFNDNGSFEDAGELIFASSTGGQFSGVLNIPVNAALGDHRMRVRLKADYNLISFNLNNSCTFYNNGEAQDYTVHIGAAPACTGLSSLGISDIGKFSATGNWGCNGCTGPFVLEYGPQGFTPGTNAMPGVNGTIVNTGSYSAVITGLTSATVYDVYVRRNCSVNGFSQNFGPLTFTTKFDACGTMETITCGQTYTVDIPTGPGEFDWYPNNGGSVDGKEKIYQFTPTVTGKYILQVTNTNFNFSNYLMKEASLGCDRYSWQTIGGVYSAPATLNMGTLNAGTTYYLMVDVQASIGTIQEFMISCASNFDPCQSIQPVTCGEQIPVNIPSGPGAFDIQVNDYTQSGLGKEAIFSYTAPANGRINISISITGFQGVGILMKQANDGCNGNHWTYLGLTYSYATGNYFSDPYTVTAGTTYYIMADASYFDGSSLTMTVSCPDDWDPCSSITSINCGQEIIADIPAGLGKFDTLSIQNTYYAYTGKELIYSFTPSQNGFYTINISSTNNAQVKYLIKGAGACNDQGWNFISTTNYPGNMYTPMPLMAGLTYYLMLDANDPTGASQTFSIICEVPPDPCASISTIGCEEPLNVSLPSGHGGLNTITSNTPYPNVGTEKIIKFTATTSDFYLLRISGYTSYGTTRFAIKEAANGCNENNWVFISDNSSDKTILIPKKLLAGTDYYLLMENYGQYYDITQTIEILCVSSNYDPCANIISIPGCSIPITSVHSTGFGKYINCANSYYYGNGIGGPVGKENIYQFTPSVTGRYIINSTAGTGEVSFAVKEISGGCNADSWICIGNAGGYFGYYPTKFPIPVKLIAGTSYYILVDANDTTGASQTFEILCPDNYDPCDQITQISCGSDYIPVPTVAGTGNYFEPACYYPYTPYGKEIMYEFTASENGSCVVEASSPLAFSFYIKKSTLGCGETGWTCLGSIQYYGANDFFTPDLIEGEKYMIMIIPGSDYGATSGALTMVLHCIADNKLYADADGDGYGDPNRWYLVPGYIITIPYGYSANNDDCNDANPNVHPGVVEICGNGIDDNCDGRIDEGCACPITISCPSNILQNASPGRCYKTISTINPVAGGNCVLSKLTWTMTGATTGNSPATGINYLGTKTFNVGLTTIIYSVSESLGNSSTCSFSVTVKESIRPEIECPDNIYKNVVAGCSRSITVPNPEASDNCAVTSLTWVMTGATSGNSPVTGINYVGTANFNVGTTTVAYTATDASGNSASCNFRVTVTDNINPTITCPANINQSVTAGCSQSISVPNPVYNDNCTVSSLRWTMTGATTLNSPTTGINLIGTMTFNVGITTVTYKVKDASGNNADCSFTVKVTDDINPTISCPANISQAVTSGCSKSIAVPDPVYGDNCAVSSLRWVMTGATTLNSPSTGINFVRTKTFNVGVTTVTYTVKDANGNSAGCSFTVTVTENIKPKITCPGNISQSISSGCSKYIATNRPSYSDNCYVASLTWVMTGSTTGSSPLTGINFAGTQNFNVGVTTIVYTVSDASGNTASCSFTVTVRENIRPTITCPAASEFCQEANNIYSILPLIASDNCGIASITYAITGTTVRSGTGNDASGIFNPGVSTIKWTVTDLSGNIATCNSRVTVSLTPCLSLKNSLTGPASSPVYDELKIKAWPNPSDQQFTIQIESNSNEAILLKVFDVHGRLVYSIKGLADKQYQFGNGFVKGVYIVEVMQGNNHSTAKLIKQ